MSRTPVRLPDELVGSVDPADRRSLGRTDLRVSRVGLGTGPLGNLYAAVEAADAADTIEAALAANLNHFDTAPLYGAGLAERRLGQVLLQRERASYVLSTKAGFLVRRQDGPDDTEETSLFVGQGRYRAVRDFTSQGIARSLRESLERLAVDSVDVLYLHEPERAPDQALALALPALLELRRAGIVGAIGAGTADSRLLSRIVRAFDLDAVLLAGGWTLLEQSAASELLPLALQRGIAVVLGGVFQGGLLVDATQTFHYRWAERFAPQLELLRGIASGEGVSLAGAAIRFALAHPAVTSVLIGARTSLELNSDLAALCVDVPPSFWRELTAAGIIDTQALSAIDVS